MPNDVVRYLRLVSEIQEELEELKEIPDKLRKTVEEKDVSEFISFCDYLKNLVEY